MCNSYLRALCKIHGGLLQLKKDGAFIVDIKMIINYFLNIFFLERFKK